MWTDFFKRQSDKNSGEKFCADKQTEIDRLVQALQGAIYEVLHREAYCGCAFFRYTYNGSEEKYGSLGMRSDIPFLPFDKSKWDYDQKECYLYISAGVDPWELEKEAMLLEKVSYNDINTYLKAPDLAKRLCNIILEWENKTMKFTEEVIIPDGTKQLVIPDRAMELLNKDSIYYRKLQEGEVAFEYEHIGTLHIPETLDVPSDKPNPFATYEQIPFVSAAPVKCKPTRIDHVDNKSPHLSIEDGVIYNADKTRLIYCFEEKTTFIVPSTVRVIGSRAFCGQEKLERIEMHNGICEIGGAAFMGCSSLKRVRIPKTVKEINWLVFAGCTSLTDIKLHDGITALYNDAFLHCDALEKIDLPDSIEMMDCFTCCFSLREIRIPPRVKSVCGFTLCRSLKKVILPDGVEEIRDYAFRFCEALEEINFPEGLKKIGTRAFYPTAIKKIVFPTTLEFIGCEAFYYCESLRSVTFKSVVNDIDEAAFACAPCWHISKPKEMKIDSSVFAQNKTLDKYGFWD